MSSNSQSSNFNTGQFPYPPDDSTRHAMRHPYGFMPRPSTSLQMFHGANNFSIDHSTISVVGRDQISNVTQIHPNSKRYGLELLLTNIAPGALHNAAERGDPPRCHENTRVAILKEILDWIRDPNARDKFIMWLYGPAGSGKTALAQSIAEALAEQGLLAASFFFWRTAAGRNTSTHFIATLAYQLSRFVPAMQSALYTAVENDPAIFSKTLTTQLRALIINPLKVAQQHVQPLAPLIIIVDGVDECAPAESQTQIIELLKTAVLEFQSIPLRILMSSRPEYEIRTAFSDSTGNKVGSLTTKFALDNDYQTNEDIKVYLHSKFQSIRDEHLQLGTRLPSPWPAEADIERIVEKASGQFVFAATVIKFLESPRINPVDHLKIILGLSRPREDQRPFAQLDELYQTILSLVVADDLPHVLELLALLVLQVPDLDINVPHAEHLLGVEVQKTLIDMHALVSVPQDDKDLLFLHHASFSDFLLDESRSQKYYLGPAQKHLKLAQYYLLSLHNKYFVEQSQELDSPIGVDGFKHHSMAIPPNKGLVDSLSSFDMWSAMKNYWYGFNEDYQELCHWRIFFDCVKYHEGGEGAVFHCLMHNACTSLIDEFPMESRSFIPAILTFRENNLAAPGLGLIVALSPLTNPHNIEIQWLNEKDICSQISKIVNDKENGGKYYIENTGYVALAEKVINVIFTKPGEGPYGNLSILPNFTEAEASGNWYPELLSHISVDEHFANFLIYQHALQYQPAIEIQKQLAQHNLAYIQKCGIDYLAHAHRPDMLGCIICDKCEGASVAEPDILVQKEFDKRLAGLVSDFPEQYRPCVPALLKIGYNWNIHCLLALPPSTRWIEDEDICKILSEILNDKARAGEYYIYGDSWLVLAKQILKACCSGSEDFLRETYKFSTILRKFPVHLDLAMFLRDHALQYHWYPHERQDICLEYVQRCGLPFLEHIHPPDTIFCIICDKYASNGASVVDIEQLPYTPTPRDLPCSWAMDDAWCRGTYETDSGDNSMDETASDDEDMYETGSADEQEKTEPGEHDPAESGTMDSLKRIRLDGNSEEGVEEPVVKKARNIPSIPDSEESSILDIESMEAHLVGREGIDFVWWGGRTIDARCLFS